MQWADVKATPSPSKLRQFAGLWLVVFVTLGAWRFWQQHQNTTGFVLAAVGLGIGAIGLVRPTAIRWVYTAWMVAAFPLGWTVSRLMLAAVFYVIFTPVALLFKSIGRDCLRLRRGSNLPTYWTPKPAALHTHDYFRQY
jgi:hypothetical protein